jgi:hypothetical protein
LFVFRSFNNAINEQVTSGKPFLVGIGGSDLLLA